MNIIETGAELLIAELGLSTNVRSVVSAISDLLGDGGGGIDLTALADKLMSEGNLDDVLNSWLGDGENSPISAQAILSVLGQANVSQFANKIGTNTDTAAEGLADVIPRMMDQASSGGNLRDSVGGMGGLLGAAKSFLT